MNNNFIEAEEFLKQPVEVQQEFMDWWQPKIGDLYFRKQYLWILDNEDYDNIEDEIQCVSRITDSGCIVPSIGNAYSTTSNYSLKEDTIPLLNMSQLINYIEDKTSGQVEIYPNFYKEKYYTIMLRDTGCGGDDPSFEICTDSLLQSLFIVACKIAKESIKYDKNI